jgi:hypothetical protein
MGSRHGKGGPRPLKCGPPWLNGYEIGSPVDSLRVLASVKQGPSANSACVRRSSLTQPRAACVIFRSCTMYVSSSAFDRSFTGLSIVGSSSGITVLDSARSVARSRQPCPLLDLAWQEGAEQMPDYARSWPRVKGNA